MVLGNSLTDDGWAGQPVRLHAGQSAVRGGLEGLRRPDPGRGRPARVRRAGSAPACRGSATARCCSCSTCCRKMKPVADDPKTPWVDGGSPHRRSCCPARRCSPARPAAGESEIRRWIIENDWLEGIVALPDQMFYNTGITTYVWILTNRKRRRPAEAPSPSSTPARWAPRCASPSATSARSSPPTRSPRSADLYAAQRLDSTSRTGRDPRVKVMRNEEFGFQRITVERPLRRAVGALTRSRREGPDQDGLEGLGRLASSTPSRLPAGRQPSRRAGGGTAGRSTVHASTREGGVQVARRRRPPLWQRPAHQAPQGHRQGQRRHRPRGPARDQGEAAASSPTPTCATRRTSPSRPATSTSTTNAQARSSSRPPSSTSPTRSTPTSPTPGSTTPRPRSATRSPSPGSSTSTHHPDPSPRSTPKSTPSKTRSSSG